jgi:phosphatidylserine/phosphatidylglycerophosphate/cardiolipin synthase-like enzyme
MNKLFLLLPILITSCQLKSEVHLALNADAGSPAADTSSCPMPARVAPIWTVHFSPKGGATEYLDSVIGQTKDSIYVQAYSFTSAPIADALIAAKKSGKTVEVILDKGDLTGKGSVINSLTDAGIKVYIDDKHAIAHNKIMIIDAKTVFTGSFNFTSAAEHSNAENSIQLNDVNLAEVYKNNWDLHKSHSYKK